MFLLDSHGQELVATVFDGAVQAKVGRVFKDMTTTYMYVHVQTLYQCYKIHVNV